MQENDQMTDEQIASLVKKTAEETANAVVKQTFITLGIDIGDPIEMQADMQHLRAWRQSVSTVKRQGMMSAVGVIVVSLIGLIWTTVVNK